MMGRPSKLNGELLNRLEELIDTDSVASVADACWQLGIARSQWYRWLQRTDDSQDVERFRLLAAHMRDAAAQHVESSAWGTLLKVCEDEHAPAGDRVRAAAAILRLRHAQEAKRVVHAAVELSTGNGVDTKTVMARLMAGVDDCEEAGS